MIYQLRSPQNKILAQRQSHPEKLTQVAKQWLKPDTYLICEIAHENNQFIVLKKTTIKNFNLNR